MALVTVPLGRIGGTLDPLSLIEICTLSPATDSVIGIHSGSIVAMRGRINILQGPTIHVPWFGQDKTMIDCKMERYETLSEAKSRVILSERAGRQRSWDESFREDTINLA